MFKLTNAAIIVLLLFESAVVYATHFRGAIVSWSPNDDGSQLTISFRISWRRSFSDSYYCDDTTIDNRTLIGDSALTCLTECSGTVASLQYYCTDYSDVSGDDWSTGRNSVLYTPTAESFSFQFSGCCWIDSIIGAGAGGGWSILATADLSVRSDTSRINSSPTVEMAPIFHAQQGCQYNIILPVGDVDGDIIRCRWATGTNECNTVCNGFTGAVLDVSACSISYTANQNTGYYAVAIQVEDFASEISTIPLSSIPLQFLVNVYTGSGCENTPDFVAPTPEENACFALDVGDNFNVTLKARGPQSFSRLTTISAVGMVRSTEAQTRDSSWHYIELKVKWTPTNDDTGRDHSLCFYATDVYGVSSTIRCINLPVSVTGPTPLRVERDGLSNTWMIVIDQTFSRPTQSAYINVYETSTNKELFSVDVSNSSDVIFDPINRQISVTFDYDFDILEDYHVTIPSGLVEGHVSCGALSVAINDSTFWNIEVDCGELTILNGIVDAPNGTDYPHSITYVCNIGHDLIGNDTRTCTSNGTWTGVEPFCKPRDCGYFSIPANGYASTNSTIYATTVTFSCVVGYEISGNSSMICDHTPAWTSSPPVCVIVDCGALNNPYHGIVSTANGTAFNEMAVYSCDLGYDLTESSSRQCQNNKQWSGVVPSCKPKDCGQLFSPPDGTIHISNTTFGSTVTYDCDLGFIIDGGNTRHCLHTGAWNGSDPTCEVVDCGQLYTPTNGHLTLSGTGYSDTGIFTCSLGYELFGDNITECLANGAWSSQEPTCSIIDCGLIPNLQNGTITYSGTTFEENATASCDNGFDLNGNSERTCLLSGEWSGLPTRCEIKDCGSLADPTDGSVNATSTIYGKTANYSCNIGYTMNGTESVTCQANGTWSSQPPTCNIRDCGSLPSISNGSIYAPKTTYGSYALYICKEEYHIVGLNNRRCMSNGNWSDKEPFCKLTDCGNLTSPDFGGVTFNSTLYLDEAVFTCNTGYELVGDTTVTCQSDNTWSGDDHVCVLKVCGFLQAPFNGAVKAAAATYQTTATFNCNEGFDLVRYELLVCTADGKWNGTAPTCLIKDCGILEVPLNGDVFYNHTTFGSEALYECDKGYLIVGVDNRTCLSNATWSEQEPLCNIKDCKVPGLLENGGVVYSGTTYSSKCAFTCDPGYSFKGVNMSVCDETGVWNNTDISCLIKDCGNLTVPEDGQLELNDTTFGSVARFSCEKGYILYGDNNRTCTEYGIWNNNYPKCVIKDCGNRTSPDDGNIWFNTTTYKSTANYSCNIGYNLIGQNTSECFASGFWSSKQPTCLIVDCGFLPTPSNGQSDINITTFGQVVNFTCDLGYDLNGDSARFCKETGKWSGLSTSCLIKDCGQLTPLDDGSVDYTTTVYQSEVSYKCNIGFDITGVSKRDCLQNGSWSDKAPTCQIKDCGMLDDIEKGNVYVPFTTFGSVASYLCDRGYHVVGDVTRVCLADGLWDGEEPFCELTVCQEVQPPEHGRTDHNSTLFEAEMMFTCDTGYTLFGDDVVVCQKDGTWSDYGQNCTIKDCGSLSAPTNGMLTINLTTYMSTVDFQCNEGYDLNGSSTLMCLANGHWNGTIPLCDIRDCGSLKAPEHGNVSDHSTTFGSSAVFSCDQGYDLVGSRVTICLSNTSWNDQSPRCEIKDCGIPIVPSNSEVSLSNTTFGSVTYYSCLLGYDLIGVNVSVCNEYGNWSNENIICQIKDCGNLSLPSNAFIKANSTSYGSKAVFTCYEGYTLSGSSERYCTEDGVWNQSNPNCTIKDCGSLADPVDGFVIYNASTYGSVADYMCDVGYYLTGSNRTWCTADGIWSYPEPLCPISDCGPLNPPLNGSIDINETTYGAQVNFSCDVGYDLIGNSTRVCLENGEWDGMDVRCEIKDCGTLRNPSNGEVSVSKTVYSGLALYSCDLGYDMKGEQTRKCLANGTWENHSPTCHIKDCGSLPNPDNGMVYIPITTYNSYALYVCDEGYHIVGPHSRRCSFDGLWDNAQPVCELTDCGDPTSPVHGTVMFENTLYGSEANYTCFIGYELVGDETVICKNDEAWSDSNQECILKDCGNLLPPYNGSLSMSSTTYNSTAILSCVDGFDLIGDSTLKCLSTGYWNGSKPTCKIRECENLHSPGNGTVHVSALTYSSSAEYICDVGFDLIGSAVRMCNSNGRWTGLVPECVLKDCGSPFVPDKGNVLFGSSMFGSSAFFNCNIGYDLDGENTSDCTQYGNWSSDNRACKIKDCGHLEAIEYGIITARDTTFNTTAYFTCNDGYTIDGVTERRCMEDGLWSSSNPTCLIKDCGQLNAPEHGYISLSTTVYGSSANYSCQIGYDLDGYKIRNCNKSGQWSNDDPVCLLTDCEPLQYPLNGRIIAKSRQFGDTAVYVCDPGYALKGSDTRECQANKSWSNTDPVCKIKDCGKPTQLKSGKIQFDTTTYGSELTVTCNAGYNLLGDAEGTCEHTGLWNLNVSECKIKDCGNLEHPENGFVLYDNTTYGSDASVQCKEGYYPERQTVHCTHSGVWNSTPKCIIQDCGNIEAPEHGTMSASSTTYNSVAVFECDTGFDLIGMSNVTCQQDGSWQNGSITCMIKQCVSPSTLHNGHVSFASVGYKAVVSFSCNTGYELVGSDELRCLEDGNWNELEPECEIRDCGNPSTIYNGRLQYNATTYGSTALYICKTGYGLTGRATITCLKDGVWENGPVCNIKECGQIPTPEHGKVFTSSVLYGALAIFSCDVGYNLVGNQLNECLENATWSNSDTRCEIAACSEPFQPIHGSVTFEGTTYGSVSKFTCDEGYEMKGKDTIECDKEGFWNGNTPDCVLIGCPRLSAPRNGNISISALTYGATAVVFCHSGYDLVGESFLKCTKNSRWSNDLPQCTIKDCGYILNLTNGNVTQESTEYGSVANFTCDYGYDLSGSNSSMCLENGSWSDNLPECKLKECRRLSDPEGGRAIQTNTTVGAVVAFTCNEGYVRSGPETVNCTLGGTWSENPPTCSKIGSPEAVYAAIGGGAGFLVIIIVISLISVAVYRKINQGVKYENKEISTSVPRSYFSEDSISLGNRSDFIRSNNWGNNDAFGENYLGGGKLATLPNMQNALRMSPMPRAKHLSYDYHGM